MTNWRGPGGSGRTAPRLHLRPWRDPRLILGVLLVLGATVLGARIAAAGDNRVEYWSVRSEVAPGDVVDRDDLQPARVRLSEASESAYLRADQEFPASLDELVWAHQLQPGSLVGRQSLVARSTTETAQLPLSVTQGAAPDDLARGDLVDVWVGPGPGDDRSLETLRVLEGVRVLQTGGEAAAASGSLAQTVLVEVDASQLATEVVGSVASGHVILVRVA